MIEGEEQSSSPSKAPTPPSSRPSLPPPPSPEDAERVTPCGGVLKSVLKKGEDGAERPPLHSRCLVHYEGLLQSSGETFIKSADEGRGSGEPAVIVAGRDASLRATGLNMAVLAMARGEKARIWIEDPKKFGYGERGSFSFPAVPPLAKLVYDVELVAFEPPEDDRDSEDDDEGEGEEAEGTGGDDGESAKKKEKQRQKQKKERRRLRSAGSLTYEERLEAASRRKLKGNALLNGTGRGKGSSEATKNNNKKDPAAALSQYLFALSYLDDDFLFQLEGPHLEAASSLARAARLNCAAARLALGDARGAAADAGEVLRERPRDAKALFRRGKARRALGDARGAVEDLKRASLEPGGKGDPAVARELAAAEAEVGAAARAGDEVMGRALAKSVGKGGLFSEQEGGKRADPPAPSAPAAPLAAIDDGDGRGEAAPGSAEQAKAGASLLPGGSHLLVAAVIVAVAVLAAAAVTCWWK